MTNFCIKSTTLLHNFVVLFIAFYFLLLSGRSYAVISQRMLMQCLESLVQKLQGGVVINFEKYGPDPPPMNPDGNLMLLFTNPQIFYV